MMLITSIIVKYELNKTARPSYRFRKSAALRYALRK
jgi:hypothetical protein